MRRICRYLKYRDFQLCYVDYVKLPRDNAYDNSPFCVRDINAGAVAWIFAMGQERKSIDGVAIQAGVNPYEFFERVDQINEMYPYEQEEEDEL